jgi:cytochrome c-type biogenesis protein CcmH/NrfF
MAAIGGGASVISLPQAHAGHWIADLLYAVPVMVVVVALGIQTLRDRKKRKNEQEIEARRRNL